MRHLGTATLETDRLLLRRFREEDAQAVYDNWGGDPAVTEFLPWPTHENVEASRKVLRGYISRYESEPDYYHWVIVVKEEGPEPVGSIVLPRMKDDLDIVEAGYCIGKKWWGRGITAEALERVIAFCFEEMGANRVEAWYDTRNPSSGRVMEKCGMKREGVLRQSGRNNQGLCDLAVYAILKEEYRA